MIHSNCSTRKKKAGPKPPPAVLEKPPPVAKKPPPAVLEKPETPVVEAPRVWVTSRGGPLLGAMDPLRGGVFKIELLYASFFQ